MENNAYLTQDAFAAIRELGALAATEGVDPATKVKANKLISSLVDKVIEPAVQKLTATISGLRI